MENDNLLDRELTAGLDEADPASSGLSAEELHRHDALISRDTQIRSEHVLRLHGFYLGLYRVCSVLLALSLIALLLWGVMGLPSFGSTENPVHNEVSRRYLESGLAEGGATNLVANMILDYRAFDTLGESNVLFTAALSVLLLLRAEQAAEDRRLPRAAATVPAQAEASADPVLRAAASVLCPVILLFGIYIVLNGHLGPGGGFSGGAVMGGALILYRCAFGADRMGSLFTFRTYKWVTFAALSFYALSKAWSFFTGANGLPSGISAGTPGAILSGGLILPLNIAVGFVVCCTMYGFFALFEKGDF